MYPVCFEGQNLVLYPMQMSALFKDIALDSDGVIRVKGHQMLWHPMHISVKLYDLIPNDFHYSLYCYV